MTTASQGAPLTSVPLPQPDVTVEVVPVSDGLDKDRFIKLQYQLYQNDLHFVPPLLMERHEFLDPAKNPFFLHADVQLFLARRGSEIVGRIAAVEDRNFNSYHEVKYAYFGLYESVNDPKVAAALLGAAKDWARWRGLDTMVGPMNLSTNYEVGLLVEGFDSDPYVMMPYNPRYYADLFESCGLKKVKDLYAWERSAATPPPERFTRIADKIREHAGITVRSIDMRDFDADVARIKEVYNSAWEKNWGFVPMTDAEFDHLVANMRKLIAPKLVLIAEDQGEPIAFSLALPDVNQAFKHIGGRLTRFGLPLGLAKLLWYSRKIDRVRLITLGVKTGWRRRGIDAVLTVETIRRSHQLGYKGGEISWVLEDNDLANRSAESCGCTKTKIYRMYQAPTAP